jgi:hypothetical protein
MYNLWEGEILICQYMLYPINFKMSVRLKLNPSNNPLSDECCILPELSVRT